MFRKTDGGLGDTVRACIRVLLIIVIVAALTGAVSGDMAVKPELKGFAIPGLCVMIVAIMLVILSPRFVKKVPDERKDSAIMLFKLGGVLLCALGAILVFCG